MTDSGEWGEETARICRKYKVQVRNYLPLPRDGPVLAHFSLVVGDASEAALLPMLRELLYPPTAVRKK